MNDLKTKERSEWTNGQYNIRTNEQARQSNERMSAKQTEMDQDHDKPHANERSQTLQPQKMEQWSGELGREQRRMLRRSLLGLRHLQFFARPLISFRRRIMTARNISAIYWRLSIKLCWPTQNENGSRKATGYLIQVIQLFFSILVWFGRL